MLPSRCVVQGLWTILVWLLLGEPYMHAALRAAFQVHAPTRCTCIYQYVIVENWWLVCTSAALHTAFQVRT